jgi:hypothetical protein
MISARTLQVDLENLIRPMLRQCKNKHVLTQECIQNLVDARASQVVITVNDNGIRVEDNSVSMNLEEIRDFWNTLGRTSKRPAKSIGEFGLGRLTLLLDFFLSLSFFFSHSIHMETRKGEQAFHVTTDRQGRVAIEERRLEQKGKKVWFGCQLGPLLDEFCHTLCVQRSYPSNRRLMQRCC